MAINDAVAAYTGLQNAAASEYKDAWAAAPSAGVGQFGAAARGLSAVNGSTKPLQTTADQANSMQAAITSLGSFGGAGSSAPGLSTVMPPPIAPEVSTVMPTPGASAGINGLPTTQSAGSASTAPVANEIDTTSNYSGSTPYVSDVTDSGDVGRQAERPDRLDIDDTMSADEQYRRAWQNEANGYFGTPIGVSKDPGADTETADPVKPTETPSAPAAVASEYGISFSNDGARGGEVIATIFDKATGKAMHKVQGRDARNMNSLLGGAGVATPDQLKDIAGWDPATPGNATGPNEWRPTRQLSDGDFA